MRTSMKRLFIPALAIASIAGVPLAASAIGINTGTGVGVSTNGGARVNTGTRVNTDVDTTTRVRSNNSVDTDVRDGERRNAHGHNDNSTADATVNSATGAETPIGKGLDVKANSAANINNPVTNTNPVNGAIGLGVGANAR